MEKKNKISLNFLAWLVGGIVPLASIFCKTMHFSPNFVYFHQLLEGLV